MNTMEDNNFDYQAYVRETPPNPLEIRRGKSERQQRYDAAMLRLAVKIDEDLLNQFRQLASEGRSCEQLINQALREWLSAQGMKEMVRAEIQLAIQQSLSSVHV